jgi:cobalt/nickel transport system permease protein
LTLQVWQRAHALHLAAQARNNDGPLRFLEASFANSARDCRIAGLAGASLIAPRHGMGMNSRCSN